MRKLQIASGTAFVAAWIVGLVLAANGPGPKDSARKVASYFAAHEHKAMVAHFPDRRSRRVSDHRDRHLAPSLPDRR